MASSEAVGVGSSVVVLAMSFNDCGLQTDSTNVVDVSNMTSSEDLQRFYDLEGNQFACMEDVDVVIVHVVSESTLPSTEH